MDLKGLIERRAVKAKLVPWSSVVGQAITLHDENEAVIGMLGVMQTPSKDIAIKLGQFVVDAINSATLRAINGEQNG